MAHLLAALLLAGCPAPPDASPAGPPSPRDPVLARLRANPLVYTDHARCRMACRRIDEEEVEAVLATGTLDPDRTRHDGRCPSYAVHGRSRDGQDLRVVYAGCDDVTLVVTAIDLETSWPCACE